MYKMILAEPNEKERNWVRSYVEEHYPDIYIAGTAETGKGVIQLLKENKPDIVLTAVELSELSGLELAAYIKEYAPEAHVVLMSSYDCVDFAIEAVHLRVDKFLLKPFGPKALDNSLRSLIDAMQEKEVVLEKEQERAAANGLAGIFAEFELVNSLLNRRVEWGEIRQYETVLPILSRGCAFVLHLYDLYERGGRRKLPDRVTIYHKVRESILPRRRCYICPMQADTVLCFVEAKENEDMTVIKSIAVQAAEALQMEYAVRFEVGIGCMVSLEEFQDSYRQALKNMNGYETDVTYAQEGKPASEPASVLNLECDIFDQIRMGQNEAMVQFDAYLQCLREFPLKERKNMLLEVLVVSVYISRLNLTEDKTYINFDNFLEILQNESWEYIEKWAGTVIRNIIKIVRIRYGDNGASVINQAQDYILEHYRHEISMEEVARLFGVTPQYFSKLFKEKLGMNYVEWVMNLRIDKAKELIRFTNIAMQDVSAKVGFSDPNYFSRAFKQLAGESPTSYLKRFRRSEENPCA